MARKIANVLCCMFLFAILGVDPAQNLAKYKRWPVTRAHTTNQWKYCDHVIHAQSVSMKQKNVQGEGPSNINLSLIICFFDVYRPS